MCSQRKMQFCLLMLCALLGYVPLSAQALTAPYIRITDVQETASIGDAAYHKPHVAVYDHEGGKDISNLFYYNYYMTGQLSHVFVSDNKQKTTDPITGSRVSLLYNVVEVGSKAGTVTVEVKVIPRADIGADKHYSTVTSNYSFTIGAVTPVVEVSQTAITARRGQTIAVPRVTLKDGSGRDVSKFYTIGYTFGAGLSPTTDRSQFKVTGTAPTQISFQAIAKPGYTGTYKTVERDIPVTVSTATGNIKTRLEWPTPNAGRIVELTDNGNIKFPIPIVRDEYGNDVTALFSFTYTRPAGDKYLTSDPWSPDNGKHWEAHLTADPKLPNGEVNITITTKPLSGYTQAEGHCTVVYVKRGVQLRVKPGKFTMVKGTLLNSSNWPKFDFSVTYDGKPFAAGEVRMVLPATATIKGFDAPTATITDAQGKQWYVYPVKMTEWKGNSWSILTDTFNFVYHVWDAGHYGASDFFSPNFHVDVVDKIVPNLRFSEEHMLANVGKPFTEPTLSITDPNGNDIAKHYTLLYSIDKSKGGSDASVDPHTGKVTLGSQPGKLKITVKATATDPRYEDGSTSYDISVMVSDFSYEIIHQSSVHKQAQPSEPLYGKLHIVGGTSVASGTTIDGVPGLCVRLGKAADEPWELHTYKDAQGNTLYYVEGGVLQVDEDNMPEGGTYYVLKPHTNGFVTVDAKWVAGNVYRLVSYDNGQRTIEDYKAPESKYGEHTFDKVLMADRTYYLYNLGAGATNEPMRMHGINFRPAFVVSEFDTKPKATASAFVNGYTGTLPKLTNGVSPYVRHYLSDTEGIMTNEYADMGRDGVVKPKKWTKTPDTTDDDRIPVSAKVWGGDLGEAVSKKASYRLFISDLPTYIVKANDYPAVGQRVTTTNIPTDITMTFGGWDDGVGPYIKSRKQAPLTDAWTVAKSDTVGFVNGKDLHVDNFVYATQGRQSAYDEEGRQMDYGKIAAGKHTEAELPCRGTYVKFEPRESGTLIVYLLQNGVCDYSGEPQKLGYGKGRQINAIKRRPIFITDETGNAVQLDHGWVIDPNLLPSGSSQGAHAGSYTEGLLRCKINDADVAAHSEFKFDNGTSFNFETKAKDDVQDKDASGQFAGYQENKNILIKAWKEMTAKWNETGQAPRQEIIALKQGYVLISKAYVRYTFQVLAGKSYYVFQYGSKLSFSGFAFVPKGFSQHPESIEGRKTDKKVSLSSMHKPGEAGAFVTTAVTNDDVTVTSDRTFEKNKWASICLPFSMSTAQVEETFGKGTNILVLDSVSIDKDSVCLKQHVYRMIVAGQPYFIRPTKDVTAFEVPNVSLEAGVEAAEVTRGDYRMKGVYNRTLMPAGAYGTKNNGIIQFANAVWANGNRAYFYPLTAQGTKLLSVGFVSADERYSFDEHTATGIERVLNNTPACLPSSKIYTIDGKLLGNGARIDSTYPQGIYVIQGKKYIIR